MADISDFRLPRHKELPTIGLYLDQTIKYINSVLAPLGCVEATPSMVANYVKKKYIEKPVKKLYNSDQIGYLIFIMLAKLVLSMDNIELFLSFRTNEPIKDAEYDRFCEAFENRLKFVFGLNEETEDFKLHPGNDDQTETDRFMNSLIVAVSHYIYLNSCFHIMQEMKHPGMPLNAGIKRRR